MVDVIRRSEQKRGSLAEIAFEGGDHGAGVSFFMGNLWAGEGPPLHSHPYAETCIVIAGTVRACVDGEEVIAEEGDVIVIGPGTLHEFKAVADGLKMVCIHESERFVIEWAH